MFNVGDHPQQRSAQSYPRYHCRLPLYASQETLLYAKQSPTASCQPVCSFACRAGECEQNVTTLLQTHSAIAKAAWTRETV